MLLHELTEEKSCTTSTATEIAWEQHIQPVRFLSTTSFSLVDGPGSEPCLLPLLGCNIRCLLPQPRDPGGLSPARHASPCPAHALSVVNGKSCRSNLFASTATTVSRFASISPRQRLSCSAQREVRPTAAFPTCRSFACNQHCGECMSLSRPPHLFHLLQCRWSELAFDLTKLELIDLTEYRDSLIFALRQCQGLTDRRLSTLIEKMASYKIAFLAEQTSE